MDRQRRDAAIDGVLVVDKPVGPTSHDIVACARRALGTSRVGHTGTLDPNASGVLPLVLGRATRLAQFLSGREKEYIATIRFGRTTDTYDAAGTILSDEGRVPARLDVERALDAFRGTFEQTPPAHSAKKVDGERAYARARAAKPVELRPVAVTVTQLDFLDMQDGVARVRVECSAGFYVRALAHDLGAALGTGAMLDALQRTRAGAFGLDAAIDLRLLTEQPDAARAAVQPLDGLLPEMTAVQLTADGARRARHGQTLGPGDLDQAWPASPDTLVRLLDPAGHLIGLAKPGTTPGNAVTGNAAPGNAALGNTVTGTLHPSLIVG